jgi:hypothetical protein
MEENRYASVKSSRNLVVCLCFDSFCSLLPTNYSAAARSFGNDNDAPPFTYLPATTRYQ